MTSPRPMLFATVVALLVATGCGGGDAPAPEPDVTGTMMSPDPAGPCADDPWMAADASADERARALVAAMDVDQKVAQVHGDGGAEGVVVPGIEDLCIPDLHVADREAGTGVSADTGDDVSATALPAPIALAATWDPVHAASYGDVLAAEARHLGRDLVTAPVVDIARVPTAGRTHEGLGEDPLLTSTMAVAQIRAMQDRGVLASVAHLGVDTQQADRATVDAVVPPRALHELYLAPFEAAVVDGEVASVTCAPNRVNGTHACESTALLQTELREGWGFDGFVRSGHGATRSTAASVAAGLDLELPDGAFLGEPLRRAIADGDVSEDDVDRMLVRRYVPMFRLGLFDRPAEPPDPQVEEHGAIAAAIAASGTVMLRNRDDLLPLDDGVASVAVVGPASARAATGRPTTDAEPSGSEDARRVSPVEGIGARAGDDVEIVLPADESAAAAVTAAEDADVAIVVVGAEPEAEGDRATLALPDEQDALISEVAEVNDDTVVVVHAGGPVLMPWLDDVDAVLMGWYPGGEDGNVTASLLFGDTEPGGRLPITFPANDLAVPAIVPERYPGVGGVATYSEGLAIGYRFVATGGPEPLFAFGHGLGYTSFEMGDVEVPAQVGPDEPVDVEVAVTNTGDRRGSHVVQVYVTSPPSAGSPRRLAGFAKVTVDPGDSVTATVELDDRTFSRYDEATGAWVTPAGLYRLHVGSSSADLPLAAEIRVG